MADIDIVRSTKLVSIDTHPANNSLVVTYEILVSVFDRANKQQLTCRSKQDQLQINISALDELKIEDLKSDKLVVNLNELGSEIERKCPLLSSDRNKRQDIQLHLLYLVNRRQSQLLATNSSSQSLSRPSSSLRLKSAQQTRLLSRSASRPKLSNLSNDVYSYYRDKYEYNYNCFQNEIEPFIEELDEYLSNLTDFEQSKEIKIDDLDTYLEGLYGDASERLNSVANIRELCKNDQYLFKISSNRLLICAMLRTLRDIDSGQNNQPNEFIFYCLIRYSSFENIYRQVFCIENDNIDLVKLVVDLLVEYTKTMLKSGEQQLQIIFGQYYSINSLLIILINLLQMKETSFQPIEQKLIIQQQGERFIGALVDLLNSHGKYLAKDVRFISKIERIIKTLNRIILILRHISTFKEFICQIRSKNIQLVDHLISLINALQTIRPINGASSNEQVTISDRQTISESYELELNAFRLVNNLIFDTKIRLRLIRKNVLKCALRNLVVFLANQRSNLLGQFDNSFVLLVPFKCLYELSCENCNKQEIFKSKIIMKCLLEYLLSAAAILDSLTINKEFKNGQSRGSISEFEFETIVLKPKQTNQYILCIWINLSASNEASIYGNDPELRDSTFEYIDSVLKSIREFSKLENFNLIDEEINIAIYLHLKLMRNLSQFFSFNQDQTYLLSWMKNVAEFTEKLLGRNNTIAWSVECLAILNNLVLKIDSSGGDVLNGRPLESLIEKLFVQENQSNTDSDDLLLVSIIFVGSVANKLELCERDVLQESDGFALNTKILEASRAILDGKGTDKEMIMNSLYSLIQLMNHSGFLKDLQSSKSNESVDDLTERLANLLTDQEPRIVRLAVILLNRFLQLEEHRSIEDSVIKKKRFSHYNQKWLNEIGSNHGEISTQAFGIEHVGDEVESKFAFVADDEGDKFFGEDLNQIQTLDGMLSSKDQSNRKVSRAGNLESIQDEESSNDDEDDDDVSFDTEPDLNVIDANSMTKHLTHRREFRYQAVD